MAAYAAVDPAFPAFIMNQVQDQAAHRREMERHALVHTTRRSTQGLVAGTVVTLSAIAAATIMALIGAPLAGMGIVIAELAVLAGVFVKGAHDQRQERERRARLMLGDDTERPPHQAAGES